MDQNLLQDAKEHPRDNYMLLKDVEDNQLGIFDRPLPCFGCGIGWFSLLLGFVFPFMWYYATILYFGNYYHKDPRERAGLAANAIALISTIRELRDDSPMEKVASPEHTYRKVMSTGTVQTTWKMGEKEAITQAMNM